MLELELGTSVNRKIDCRQYPLLIIRMDILLQPFTTWLIRVGNKLTSFELAHLLPVRTHAINHVGTGHNESSIKRFTFAQLTSDPSALDTFPTACSHEANEFNFVDGPL